MLGTYARAASLIGALLTLPQVALAAGVVESNQEFAYALGFGEFSPGVTMAGRWLAFTVSEVDHFGQDLNGDGDVSRGPFVGYQDNVVHVRDLATGETTNLGLVSNGQLLTIVSERWLVFTVVEGAHGLDLDGSGEIGGANVLFTYDLLSGDLVNVGLAVYVDYDGYYVAVDNNRLAFSVPEHFQNQDLNGDGEITPRDPNFLFTNRVAHIYDLPSQELTNLGVVGQVVAFSGDYLATVAHPSDTDGNWIPHRHELTVHDVSTGHSNTLGVEPLGVGWRSPNGHVLSMAGDWLVFVEAADDDPQGVYAYQLSTQALMGPVANATLSWPEDGLMPGDSGEAWVPIRRDGRLQFLSLPSGEIQDLGALVDEFSAYCATADRFIFSLRPDLGEPFQSYDPVHDVLTNLGITGERCRGFGEQVLLLDSNNDVLVHDVRTGENIETGRSPADFYRGLNVSGRWLATVHRETPPVRNSTPEDLNHDGDTDDEVLLITTLKEPPPFIRGDSNGDGSLSITDAIATLESLFAGGLTPGCQDAADFNDDGAVNISDAVSTLAYLFSGGSPPPAPTAICGPDPTEDSLGCEYSPGCE